jgi:FkbM family methyltransferase
MSIELLGDPAYDNGDGVWNTETSSLNKDSTVYSFGIGHNAVWDEAMIQKFGCNVYAFDMTPEPIKWVAGHNFQPQFIFHPYGISDFDGNAPFHLRKKPHWLMAEASLHLYPEGEVHMLPVKTLKTIMHELGHAHIDVLKIDIEGEEYKVLRNIKGISISQILVEIHTPTKSEHIYKFIVLLRLLSRGYRLAHRSGADYTFVKK